MKSNGIIPNGWLAFELGVLRRLKRQVGHRLYLRGERQAPPLAGRAVRLGRPFVCSEMPAHEREDVVAKARELRRPEPRDPRERISRGWPRAIDRSDHAALVAHSF